jgi:hypothetical protein
MATPRFVVVVPPDRPDVYEQLTHTMEGENVRVLIDRRRVERREPQVDTMADRQPLVDRRRTYRRGNGKLTMTAAHPANFQARSVFTLP